MNLIQTLEAEEIARLNKTIPEFAPGDTVIVSVNVVEGTRKRVQAYEGVVIAKRNRGLNSGFTVRKISSGEGVERTFQTYSPLIASIEVKRRGDVRRAKLYYLRDRSGKSAPATASACSGFLFFGPWNLLFVNPSSPPAVSSVIAPLSSLPDFDPRTVPVVGVDAHLPAVPLAVQTPDALRARFAQPPQWEPEVVLEKKFMNREPAHASVLLAIVLREQPMVLLTERTAHLSTHSGQVAFPGGRADPEDASAAETALREAQEEVGLDRDFVEVLGTLPTYVTGSSFIITPVVALVQPDCLLRPNPYEVADLFEVPLAFLLDPAHHRRHVFDRDGVHREWFSMPYQQGDKTHFIWGATAGMLRNFYRFMMAE
eukprot:gene10781-10857_t